MNQNPDKETHDIAKVDSLEKFRMLSNYLLCRVIPYPKTTKSGIIISIMTENQYMAQNADRVFEVVKLPERLRFVGVQKSAVRPVSWVTDMDLKVGDKIWVTAFETVNCQQIIIDGQNYSMIHYEEVRAAKRGEEIITVNGWILCHEIEHEERVLEYSKKKISEKELRVLCPAKANKSYVREYKKGKYTHVYLDLEIEINPGDIIIKYDTRFGTPLEDDMHRTFDGDNKIICIQSRHIGGIRNES